MRTMLCLSLGFFCSIGLCGDNFFYTEKKDDITNEDLRYVGVVSEDKGFRAGGSLVLYGYADGTLRLSIDPEKTIMPDEVLPDMIASVSIRSTEMDKPITKDWDMRTGSYDTASIAVSKAEAKKIFGGESVTVQLNKTGQRIKFRTSGNGYENLGEAVDKVVAKAKK